MKKCEFGRVCNGIDLNITVTIRKRTFFSFTALSNRPRATPNFPSGPLRFAEYNGWRYIIRMGVFDPYCFSAICFPIAGLYGVGVYFIPREFAGLLSIYRVY